MNDQEKALHLAQAAQAYARRHGLRGNDGIPTLGRIVALCTPPVGAAPDILARLAAGWTLDIHHYLASQEGSDSTIQRRAYNVLEYLYMWQPPQAVEAPYDSSTHYNTMRRRLQTMMVSWLFSTLDFTIEAEISNLRTGRISSSCGD